MKKLSYIFLFFLALGTITVSSCRDEASIVGNQFFESHFKEIQTDTCTVLLKTILSDSLATSGDTICQIGHYHDNIRGNINVSYFSEYTVTTTRLDIARRYSFDSITVRLYPSGDYVGDTLAGPQKIAIYKMTQSIEYDNSNYQFNCTNIKTEDNPFTTFSFTPHPGNKKKGIEVRLPDAFGQDWFNRMINTEDRMEKQEYFRDYFKGFAYKPLNTDVNINGFQANDSSFVISLYYHDITNTPTANKATFSPNTTRAFNHVDFDRSNTPIAALKPGIFNALSSTETGNVAHLQGLTGLYVMIDFPFLNNIMSEGEMVSIEKAYLQFYPVRFSYGDKNPLPSKLSLYTTDVNGVSKSVVTDLGGTSVQTGNLVTDYATNINTYYTFDVTSFLQSNVLGKTGENRERLKLVLPDKGFFSTCEGVLFGDMKHPTSNVKLTLVYKTYNKQ